MLRERTYLRNLVVWLWFTGMNDVGKFHGVLNEENWNIVSNDIPIAFLCIELDGKASDIPNSVCRSTTTKYCPVLEQSEPITKCRVKGLTRNTLVVKSMNLGDLSQTSSHDIIQN